MLSVWHRKPWSLLTNSPHSVVSSPAEAAGAGGAGFVLSQSCKVPSDPWAPRPQCWVLGLASAGLASDCCSLKLLGVFVCVVGLRRAGSTQEPSIFPVSLWLTLGWVTWPQLCSMIVCHENWGISDWCSLMSRYGRENSNPGWGLSLTAYS